MYKIMLPAALIAAVMVALAGAGSAAEVRLMTGPQAGIRVPLGGQLESTWDRVQWIPGTGMADAVPASTRIIVPCEVGSRADIVARDLARMLSMHHGHDYLVENLSPDAARTRAQQEDARTILFFGSNANGAPICGD
jgi:hypothetical protein